MLLFGYRKMPDAARSLGRSLRIFKSEMSAAREEPPAVVPVVPPEASPETPTS